MGTFENNPSDALDWKPVDDAVAKFASKFWGIDTGHSLVPLPQTAQYKLEFLRRTLVIAPNLNRHTLLWVEGKRQKTAAGIEKYLKSPVFLPLEISSAFTELPKTAQQAYKIVPIADRLHTQMAADQSPIEYVYRGYERYRETNAAYISEPATRIGHLALELFVFAAGGEEFAKQLQETTAQFYEQQQKDVVPASVDFPAAM